jgi:hypothetical protein
VREIDLSRALSVERNSKSLWMIVLGGIENFGTFSFLDDGGWQ